jgi:hypothetical protein
VRVMHPSTHNFLFASHHNKEYVNGATTQASQVPPTWLSAMAQRAARALVS